MNVLVFLGLSGMTLVLALTVASWVSPWLPQQIIRWSARRLGDVETATRFQEEWEAELALLPGKVSMLTFALGRAVFLPLTAREVRLDVDLRGGRAPAEREHEPEVTVWPVEPSNTMSDDYGIDGVIVDESHRALFQAKHLRFDVPESKSILDLMPNLSVGIDLESFDQPGELPGDAG